MILMHRNILFSCPRALNDTIGKLLAGESLDQPARRALP
jgi:hypothetical protein